MQGQDTTAVPPGQHDGVIDSAIEKMEDAGVFDNRFDSPAGQSVMLHGFNALIRLESVGRSPRQAN